jgi:hypothetical protein
VAGENLPNPRLASRRRCELGPQGGRNSRSVGRLIVTRAKGSYSVLYNFDGSTGAYSYVTPILHTTGVVYGDTHSGATVM